MSLETIATLMSILASFAVIATLGMIALQIQQNTKATRLSAAQQSTQLFIENLARVIENPDLAQILAERDFDNLSDGELLRITNFQSASFRLFELLHAQQEAGHYQQDLWQGTKERLTNSLHSPAIRNLWLNNRKYYSQSFVTYVDGLLETIDEKKDMDRSHILGVRAPATK